MVYDTNEHHTRGIQVGFAIKVAGALEKILPRSHVIKAPMLWAYQNRVHLPRASNPIHCKWNHSIAFFGPLRILNLKCPNGSY